MSKSDRHDESATPARRASGFAIWSAALLLALLATYSNHFDNSFHFDDMHTIVYNPYVRDLRFLPTYFTDARTLSVYVDQQGYRPLISASLAIDYWAGGGLNPRWFHLSTFGWYVVLLLLMYTLFVRIVDRASPGNDNRFVALFAVAWYALHPVSAESINYIWQRGEVYSTLGVVGGLVTYQCFPRRRRLGLYLLPPLVAMFAKQTATMFAPLLFVYILLFEGEWASRPEAAVSTNTRRARWPTRAQLLAVAGESVPAFLVSGGYYFFQRVMTAATFDPGGYSPLQYWYTQPPVLLHYFVSFFLPTKLTGDSDRQLLTSLSSPESVAGLLFIAAVLLAAWKGAESRRTRPVAFGLLWFLIASLPTSLIPLGEVENDHRMFFPFVGLVLAVCWFGKCVFETAVAPRWKQLRLRRLLAPAGLILLASYAYGAHVRNEVWHTEESFWRDVTIKSPRNGRGIMNYGLQLMARGDYRGALQNFKRAEVLLPRYSALHVNIGIACGGLHDDAQAEEHFRTALQLAPADSVSYSFYAHWLHDRGRTSEGIDLLRRAVALNGNDLDPAHLLMMMYSERGDANALKQLATQTLQRFPNDPESARYLATASRDPVAAEREAVSRNPTPEGFVNLSLSYERAGRHDDCIAAAREALKLRPDYAEAYNNISAANLALERWEPAIEAAREAVRLRPDFQLARNNLEYALGRSSARAGGTAGK